ncbi:hypothetical protein [Sulfobacillus thermosulfidooxidans]|uniref:hypothetical protein n=1 Tax=Sulfobacillus thermosulfidooxidans TaxID=28034 RepID=UPI0002EECF53|nr:hypothetical protein [Sulfobacillus thermosulfidooxidans]
MAEGTRYYTWAVTQWIPAITSHELQDVDEALFKMGYDFAAIDGKRRGCYGLSGSSLPA